MQKNMSLVQSLTCACTPGRVYANPASFRRHQQTQKHAEYVRRDEEKGLRIRLQEAEREIARLRRENERLSDYLRYPSRRQVTARTKKEVAARATWKCEACGTLVSANYEVDHVVPLFRGGGNEMENLRCLCPDCHRTKTAEDRRGGAIAGVRDGR